MQEKMKSSFLVHCSRGGMPDESFFSAGTWADSAGGPLDMAAAASSTVGVVLDLKNFGIALGLRNTNIHYLVQINLR